MDRNHCLQILEGGGGRRSRESRGRTFWERSRGSRVRRRMGVGVGDGAGRRVGVERAGRETSAVVVAEEVRMGIGVVGTVEVADGVVGGAAHGAAGAAVCGDASPGPRASEQGASSSTDPKWEAGEPHHRQPRPDEETRTHHRSPHRPSRPHRCPTFPRDHHSLWSAPPPSRASMADSPYRPFHCPHLRHHHHHRRQLHYRYHSVRVPPAHRHHPQV